MNTMLSEVLSFLEKNKGHWPEIAKEADVGYEWLTKFASEKIAEPGYYKVERLYAVAKKAAAA